MRWDLGRSWLLLVIASSSIGQGTGLTCSRRPSLPCQPPLQYAQPDMHAKRLPMCGDFQCAIEYSSGRRHVGLLGEGPP